MYCHNGLERVPEHRTAVGNIGQCIHVRSSKSPRVMKVALYRKTHFIRSIMNVLIKEAQAKFVPAAAVKRIVQVLDLMTRCKRPHRRLDMLLIKDGNRVSVIFLGLSNLNMAGVDDTLYVKVKFVEI